MNRNQFIQRVALLVVGAPWHCEFPPRAAVGGVSVKVWRDLKHRRPGVLPPEFSPFYALALCAGVYLPGRLTW